ncbi:MAG: CapA family protein [Acidobacteriota bacterium]
MAHFLAREFAGIGAVALATLAFVACDPKMLGSDETSHAATIKPTPTPNYENSITIAAVGDIMLGSTSINNSFLPPQDGREILKPLIPVLTDADITFGNLEGPLLEGGTSTKCPPAAAAKPGDTSQPAKCFAFRVPTRYGKYLKEAGFDVMSVANNHAGDFGEYGRSSTRKVLDSLGIKYAGAGRAALSTTILSVKGKKIAFVGFAHNNIVPNLNDIETAKQLVIAAKKKADLVVVSFHGGAEGETAQHVPKQTEVFVGEKRGNVYAFAHAVIDAGADLVLGHGPHVNRALEIYKGRLIDYSMGNFCTYGMFSLNGPQSLAAVFHFTIGLDGKFIVGKIIPAKQEGRGGPIPDPSGGVITKIQSLSAADFPTTSPTIADDGTIGLR